MTYVYMLFRITIALDGGGAWGGYLVIEPSQLENVKDIFIILAIQKFEECKRQLQNMAFVQNDNMLVAVEGIADKYLEDFKDKNEAEVVVLGDCTLNSISLRENEKECLAEKFDSDLNIKVLAQNGIYMRFYYNIFNLCIRNMHRLKKVVLMFSVDIFSNQYHMLPANQHKDILDAICMEGEKKSSELCDFIKEVEIRNRSNAINFSSPNRGIENEELILRELRNHTLINYLYRMKKDNESLKYLRKFIQLCHVSGVECVCILMPVNYEMGLDLFSTDFIEKYEKNKAKICDVISEEKGFFCDLSYQLRGDQFMTNRSSNEGILYKGRTEVYDRVKLFL